MLVCASSGNILFLDSVLLLVFNDCSASSDSTKVRIILGIKSIYNLRARAKQKYYQMISAVYNRLSRLKYQAGQNINKRRDIKRNCRYHFFL